ncbi:MAG: carboxymuconolactone decarboxylase family protein [Acidobacteria bacterium]|nr:carboxymuconolactone decarboxylase family protein [Acidobacteriota bacterium]
MKTKLPDLPETLARQYPDVWKSFEALANRCHEAGPLDAKTRRLVKLGIAVGAGLEGGVHAQVRNALAEGITASELRHVVLLGLTTIGFPASMARFTWINDVLGKSHRARRPPKSKP